MKIIRFVLTFFFALGLALAIFFMFKGQTIQVFQPEGIIARQELNLILVNLTLMGIILIPTFVWLLSAIWKYRANNDKAQYEPEKTYGKFNQAIIWSIPSLIVLIMALHTWKETHHLDPYKRIESAEEELLIQVVALDWKWLFIYPKEAIVTVNFVQFPEKRPIRFELAADGSPMNSFWIPQLSGQIYCMTGMVTPLHIMADGVGMYPGRAAEINGEGYAQMTFVAKSTTQQDFDTWIDQVKSSPTQLNQQLYEELLTPSIDDPIKLFSGVKNDLFEMIVMKYMP